jgi:ABC-type branched-subunit amino acid transport system ATPase component
MQTILTVEHINGGYDDRRVLHDITLQVSEDERILLIGPNGCGKTTLLKIMAGSLKPESGRVVFEDHDITHIPEHARMRMEFGYLMQTSNIFPSLTVDENLHLSFWHGSGEYQVQRDQHLQIFPDLRDKLSRRAGLLSGGERQMLAVCMVLMRPVKLLLLDEPTAGLAPKAAENILRAIHEAQASFGFSSIMVEHNLRLVNHWMSRVLVMKQGRIVREERDPKSLLSHDRLQGYYF